LSKRLVDALHRARSEGRGALSVYIPFGFPAPHATTGLLDAAVAGGADWIELGLPFSDPAADGPVLQQAAAEALRAGATVQGALGALGSFRRRHDGVPVVAMTYANVVHRRGWDRFAADWQDAGGDGLIVPDVPLEEADPLRQALAGRGLAHIPLVTPTTGAARMKAIAQSASGFLYVVANVGVTGQTDPGPVMAATVQRARQARPDLPLAVGFGIRSSADVRRVLSAGADAAIVGSHLVPALRQGPDAVTAAIAELRRGC
jgi:tryptophan synthase alpha chain